MMKSCSLSLAFVFLMVISVSGRDLSQDTSATCKSFGALRIRVTEGSCSGSVSSSCASIAEAEEDMKQTSSLFLERDVCEEESMSAFSEATATIVAQVFTKAFVKIKCTGQGSGCGWSLSSGEAVAADLAQALSKSVLSANDEQGTSIPFCVADIETLAAGFAAAASKSQASACQKGPGTTEDYEESLIRSTTVAVAKAFTSALSVVCKGEDKGSKCDIKGNGETNVTNTAKFKGTGLAVALGGQLAACKDSYATCCDKPKMCLDMGLRLSGPGEDGSYAVRDLGDFTPSCSCF